MKHLISSFAAFTLALFGGTANANVTIENLSPKLSREIHEKSDIGRKILDKYNGENSEHSADSIDAAIEKWRSSKDKNKEPAALMVDALGAYFGNLLAKHLDLEWMVYKDKQGKDLCVIHKRFSVSGFPHSAIYKAVVEKRTQALANVESALASGIKEAKSNSEVMPR